MSSGRALALIVLGLSALVTLGRPQAAQAQDPVVVATAILVLDQERLFVESRFGKAVMARHLAAKQALQEENLRIERELEAEEQDLTKRRANLAPSEFQKLATEFDQKAEEIRMVQGGKSDEMTRWLEAERQRFGRAAGPVLQALRVEMGASILLDRRVVLFYDAQIDVTDPAIRRLDAVLGDGPPTPADPAAPATQGAAPAEP